MNTTERQARIDRIRRFPAELTSLVENLSEAQRSAKTIEEEWTVRQIVHHLPDSHMNSVTRLKLILTEDVPTIQPYDQDLWAELHDVHHTPIEASLLILRGLHERWCDLFESLDEAQWSRKGYHPEIGDITPVDLVQIYSDHCDEHIDQINRVLQAGTV